MRILIAGGGIVGLATAWRLSQRNPDHQITVLEKEAVVCAHQTGRNSGVLHSGLPYRPGTARAKLAVKGIRQMVEFCQENGVPHNVCGMLVVATQQEQIPRMNALYERGTANGLQGLRVLKPEQMREVEPHVGGIAALHVPEEGIVDYKRVCAVLAEKITATPKGRVVCNAKVTGLRRAGNEWIAETTAGEFQGDALVNCTGLFADRTAKMAGERRGTRIVPFRGEYYKLKKEREYLVRGLIYPVSDPRFPFLGVHMTRMVTAGREGVEAGPNAVLALAREGYKKSDINLYDVFDALTYSGTWRFLFKYPTMCYRELRRSFSTRLFIESAQTLIPELQFDDLQTAGSGVRAQALSPEGSLVEDFEFQVSNHAVHVINAPSPAATASLAIGEVVADKLEEALA